MHLVAPAALSRIRRQLTPHDQGRNVPPFLRVWPVHSRAAKRGGFKRGGVFPIWTCPSLFVLFRTFPIFLGFSRFARGWSGDFPDSFLFSFSAYEEHLRGTVPKGSATQSGPFPKKVGNTRVWKPPGLASLNSHAFFLHLVFPSLGRNSNRNSLFVE